MSPDRRSAWLKKLDEECPYQGGAPPPAAHGRQRHHGLPPEARRRVRHVRRRRVGRVRALLLPGPDGRRGLSVALRAKERAAQARRLTSDHPSARRPTIPRSPTGATSSRSSCGTRDGRHVLLFAGNSLDEARALFAAYGKRRPRARLTIRQRSRVVAEWP
jgi:hypothetical protein